MEKNENAHAAANQTKEITPAAIAITSLISGVGLEKKRAIEDERKTTYQSKQPFLSSSDFPPVFVFGIATSAYQVTLLNVALSQLLLDFLFYSLNS